jgi:predicted DNA-binding protein (MmcQ/YjbR family)
MTEATEARLLDTAALLADLAAWWESYEPRPDPHPASPAVEEFIARAFEQNRRDRGVRRIAGSEFDQEIPEGTRNPYWEIIRQLPLDETCLPWKTRPEPMLHWLHGQRDEYKMFADRFAICGTYSWSICSPGDITWMREVLGGRGVVEPGAGTGYWAWQMEQAGISVAAYEPNQPEPGNHFARREWTTVLRDDHSAAGHHPDRALFLCWPSYDDPWAAQALACYSGDLLIYAGEGEGGCTADDEFFRLLEAEWDEIGDSPKHVSYWGIHCYLTAYRRRGHL